MQVQLNYGKNNLRVDLSDSWQVTVIEKPRMPVLQDPDRAVREAFNNPTASRSLREEALGCRSACILICDITRPVPNGTILPGLIRELLQAGLEPSAITILVATGLHRPNEGRELQELIGDEWVYRTIPVANHHARDEKAHVSLGDSRGGIPIKLDRRFVAADLKIVTGLVEPHFMAGYSGGRKLIVPGIAHADTICAFHTARMLESPQARNCNLEGNPLHDLQLESARFMDGILAVNTVIDADRAMAYVNFGELVESHLQAVEFLRPYAEVPLSTRFKTVLTSAGGYPLDQTYYQTVKGMVGAMDILEPGGNLIIVSECAEGLGSAEFVSAQECLVSLGMDGFLAHIADKTRAEVDEWQTEMQLKPMRKGNIHLFSEKLSASHHELTGVARIASLADFITQCVRRAGDDRIAVIPEGPYVIPFYRPGTEKERRAAAVRTGLEA